MFKNLRYWFDLEKKKYFINLIIKGLCVVYIYFYYVLKSKNFWVDYVLKKFNYDVFLKWYYVINFFFDGVSIYNGINLLFYFIFLYLVVYVIKIKYFLLILMIYMDDLIDILWFFVIISGICLMLLE